MNESGQTGSGSTTLARGESAPVDGDARKPPFLAEYAYATAVSEGKGVFGALRSECRQCFKNRE